MGIDNFETRCFNNWLCNHYLLICIQSLPKLFYLCNHYIQNLSRLKFFKKGETEGLKFRGSRDISSIKSFIYEQLGKTVRINKHI
jgi:hypothetical protein